MSDSPVYPDLKGKTVVITGGSSGIGLDSARRYLSQETKVAILALEDQLLGKAENELQQSVGKENVVAVGCNLTRENEVKSAFEKILD